MMVFRYRFFLLPLAAVVLGGLVGNAAERLPIHPVGQSVVAIVLVWFAALLLVSFVLQLRFPSASDVPAPSLDLRQVLLTTLLAVVVGLALHVAMAWIHLDFAPEILDHRPVVAGVAGFVAGSIHAAVVCGVDL